MAQVSAFIFPTTTIETFDHGEVGRRVAGLRFDGVVTLHLSGGGPDDDVRRIQSCDNLIAAVQVIRAAAEARLTAVPA